jgi:parallel beta-helix repeat protein
MTYTINNMKCDKKFGICLLFLCITITVNIFLNAQYFGGITPPPTLKSAPTGKVYYVATTGSDNNPGTESQPWLTITKATNTLIAGDTVYIKQGVYNEQVRIRNSGSSGKYITYAAYPGDENKAIIDGSGINVNFDFEGIVQIEANGYINFTGFRVVNSNFALLSAPGPIRNLTVYNNTFYNAAGYCAHVGSRDTGYDSYNITFDKNDMGLCSNGEFAEAFALIGVDGFEIKNVVLHDCGDGEGVAYTGGEGIDIINSANGSVHNNIVYNTKYVGIYLDSGSGTDKNIDVYNNLIHDVRESTSFAVAAERTDGVAKDINIYNNIVYNTATNSFALGNYSTVLENISINSNTFIGSIWLPNNQQHSNITLRNTIASDIIDGVGAIKDHNFFTDLQGSAGFVNEEKHDYHLAIDSKVRNIGTASGSPAFDYDGIPRPQGDGYDIGAFEYRWLKLL